jgi:hypothetical protein
MGDYVDLKFLPGLKSARVFVDIPIEHSNEFLKMFEAPDRANPVKVIIARYVTPAAEQSLSDVSRDTDELRSDAPVVGAVRTLPDSAVEDRNKPRTFTKSQKAALKLRDYGFCDWLYNQYRPLVIELERAGTIEEGGSYADNADTVLKNVLGVNSKTELDQDGPKAESFEKLLTSFDCRNYSIRS